MTTGPNEYFVGEEITLSCLFLVGQTEARIDKGQSTVYVADPSDLTLTAGSPIVVVGAGYVGGDLRTTVVSDDGIGAIVLADSARSDIQATVAGTPTDPSTCTCRVELPDGTESTVTAASTLVGLWKATFTPTIDGTHFYRFIGTGPASGDGWKKFIVLPERVA